MPNLPFNIPQYTSVLIIPLTGIPSGESFSGPLSPERIVYLSGVPSAESFGTLLPDRDYPLTGIDSSEAFGTMIPHRYLELTGISTSEAVGGLLGDTNYVPPVIPLSRPTKALSASERFSSPIVSQNVSRTDTVQFGYNSGGPLYYQTFNLSADLKRGTESGRMPFFTGLQVLADVRVGWADVTNFDWTLEYYAIGAGWQTLESGTTSGAPLDGENWITAYTDKPILIQEDWLDTKFRIGLNGRSSIANRFKEIVSYENGKVLIGNQTVDAQLELGKPYHFIFQGDPAVLYRDPFKDIVYFSVEQRTNGLGVTTPNPLAPQNSPNPQAPQYSRLYASNGTTPIEIGGEEVSLNFRILAGVAETGTDFLGNRYRNALASAPIENVGTSDSQYWLSKPNPSRFAIESMYFDISDGLDRAKTIDSILIDPLTPGVYFSVYYSSDGEPSTDDSGWEDKLWTRVPQEFVTKHKATHPLPAPITARYVKVEFTLLQPRLYSPGDFQKPVLYKKHPKWVLDYFLARIAAEKNTEDPFIGKNVAVTFGSYDLAYNYYLDDLDPSPLRPNPSSLIDFLDQRVDESDLIDRTMYSQIRARLKPYTNSLASIGATGQSLINRYTLTSNTRNLTSETLDQTSSNVTRVSSLDREKLIFEKDNVPMYFFLPCRHRYRILKAEFENDKGYFAGVKEIAFLRERYSKAYDSDLYIESAGDQVNNERNDFIVADNNWTV